MVAGEALGGMVINMGESGSQAEPKGKSPHAVGEIWRLLQEKDEIIKSQERTINCLQDEVKILKSEREELLRKLADRGIGSDDRLTKEFTCRTVQEY
ncbi:hypothetical protein KUTeg_021115 [Tegillarca granosa]|uniref:Uncharacterized protein n=1 Tax=Tegillarca granosa TaxID=220873 RepID=A0ABQ9EFT5_TEGGR|nr:hypothetical protein KUTeg_021115 [Tegillarca granosa]